MNKRLLKELKNLIVEQNKKSLLENDYLVSFDETNLNKVHAIIKCPYDSIYRHKFVRLTFDIPEDYPHSPPKVTFVNYDGVRIHPNMYEDGKCCSTILNTWPSENEKWTSSMGIETILLTFHSFFDNNPYTYEPGGRDDPSYTEYVLFQSWKTCLLRYVHDYSQPDIFITFIHNYLMVNVEEIFNDLTSLIEEYPYGPRYTRCFEIDNFIINYENVIYRLEQCYQYIDYRDNYATQGEEIDYDSFINKEYNCNICFDTIDDNKIINLKCKHSFHNKCLYVHINNNGNICSLCRNEIDSNDLKQIKCSIKRNLEEEWIINPETKRRVKVGGRTYQRLIDEGIIKVNEI